MVLSPFGWGELCLRDFEAIACGCVLIKPDMSHLTTSPDIFIPGETYIPVRWDFSDLRAACDWCLHNPDAAQRIAANAQSRLLHYLEHDGFVADARRLLQALHLAPVAGQQIESKPAAPVMLRPLIHPPTAPQPPSRSSS